MNHHSTTLDRANPDVTKIVLIRHADFVSGKGDSNPGLSPLGVWQCQQLRSRLATTGELSSATTFLCSPLARARQTADLISDQIGGEACTITEVDDIREMHWGAAEGLSWDELVRRHGEPDGPRDSFAPGGESWQSFVARATNTLEAIAHKFAGGTIVIVAHTGIIEASFVRFAGLKTRANRFAMAPRNTGLTTWISVVSDQPTPWRLELYNDVSHLWSGGYFHHRDDGYASLVNAGDPFWRAIGEDH